jgi:deoxyribodipyrimidine photo-lyase
MKVVIFWFRRDLRLEDNSGLYHALKSGWPVLPLFIFDTNILEELEEKADRRVDFIHRQVTALHKALEAYGSTLQVYHGRPDDAFKKIIGRYDVQAVYTNRDYEPYAIQRDKGIAAFLNANGTEFRSFKDQVIFEQAEIVKDNREPYTVFTPYSKKWKAALTDYQLKPYPVLKYSKHFLPMKPLAIPGLASLGFIRTDIVSAVPRPDHSLILHYDRTRDNPGIRGTTRLGIHLRFGTLSIRRLAAIALTHNETFLNELIWRDFFMMILWHYPKVVNTSFRAEYDAIQWRNKEEEFELWCKGQTGYPIVDAGMRELNQTGFMHNRIRMIAASFLTKHLLIDWRWGEAYFAKKLLDYDLAANNGNWQWAAGCGCDAAPYFRVFSPQRQTERFDPQLAYTRLWVPELETAAYPPPVIAHDIARERCLKAYKKAIKH